MFSFVHTTKAFVRKFFRYFRWHVQTVSKGRGKSVSNFHVLPWSGTPAICLCFLPLTIITRIFCCFSSIEGLEIESRVLFVEDKFPTIKPPHLCMVFTKLVEELLCVGCCSDLIYKTILGSWQMKLFKRAK